MKTKPKFPFKGKESKGEEKAEKRFPPKAYKQMERAEGAHKFRSGGKVGKRGC